MGPHMAHHLAGGRAGLRHLLEHIGPGMERWWGDLGRPELTPAVIDRLVAAFERTGRGRSPSSRPSATRCCWRCSRPCRRPAARSPRSGRRRRRAMSRIAVVTGGSRGIGAATAKLLAAEGYDVAINYRSRQAAAEAVAAAARAHGVRALTVQGDVAQGGRRACACSRRSRSSSAGRRRWSTTPASSARSGGVEDVEAGALRAVFELNVVGCIPLRARGGAADVDPARRPGRGDRQSVLDRGAHGQRQHLRALRRVQGRDRCADARPRARGRRRTASASTRWRPA